MTNDKIQKITACAFIHKDGKLFIARRADTKKFLPGKFELPGGHIEFGEAMEEGLRREIMEEFGFEVLIGDPYYSFTYVRDGGSVHSVEVDYLVTLKDPDRIITLNPADHSEYHWIGPEEVAEYFAADDEEGVAVRKGFARLGLA